MNIDHNLLNLYAAIFTPHEDCPVDFYAKVRYAYENNLLTQELEIHRPFNRELEKSIEENVLLAMFKECLKPFMHGKNKDLSLTIEALIIATQLCTVQATKNNIFEAIDFFKRLAKIHLTNLENDLAANFKDPCEFIPITIEEQPNGNGIYSPDRNSHNRSTSTSEKLSRNNSYSAEDSQETNDGSNSSISLHSSSFRTKGTSQQATKAAMLAAEIFTLALQDRKLKDFIFFNNKKSYTSIQNNCQAISSELQEKWLETLPQPPHAETKIKRSISFSLQSKNLNVRKESWQKPEDLSTEKCRCVIC